MLSHCITRCALAACLALGMAAGAAAAELRATPARAFTGANEAGFDGVVEAVRQTVVAAQVPGAVVQLDVKVGDRVGVGQVLLRLDARAADQATAASDAQVQAARASLDVATKDFERQRQLFQDNFISQAALERAESAFKSTRAQVDAQRAQSGAARTQSGFHVVRAPFAGVVAEVPVSLGDMAMPGRPLLTLYDPTALRVTASVPQTVAAQLGPEPSPRIELPGLAAGQQWFVSARAQLLPTVDAGTHTVTLRADLPSGTLGAAPGMFARLWLPVSGAVASSGAIPVSVLRAAIVRRAEMTGLYVLDPNGKPVLRQVRLGRVEGEQVEILSGLTPGERVAADPQAAARVR
jgi:RND family efflux transporter MFP subunit